MHSKDLSGVDQVGLMLARRVDPSEVSLDAIMRCRDLMAAINLMFNASGLEDKEIYAALQIDPGHFSNIRRGKPGHHFPTNKLDAAMDLCKSEIPLIWQAHKRGKGIHLLITEAERQLAEERTRRIEAEKKNDWYLEVLQGRSTK